MMIINRQAYKSMLKLALVSRLGLVCTFGLVEIHFTLEASSKLDTAETPIHN